MTGASFAELAPFMKGSYALRRHVLTVRTQESAPDGRRGVSFWQEQFLLDVTIITANITDGHIID